MYRLGALLYGCSYLLLAFNELYQTPFQEIAKVSLYLLLCLIILALHGSGK